MIQSNRVAASRMEDQTLVAYCGSTTWQAARPISVGFRRQIRLGGQSIMRNCLATKILSIVMMMLTPAAMLMAETSNTMLYASGTVTLNGTEVARSASVTTGDRIETAGASATAINQGGTKVTVNPYSAIRYESEGVNVVRGTAAVSTTDGMTAKAAQITVSPRDKAATYEIARMDNNIVITSHTGALMVTEAGKTTELEAGGSS